MANETSQRVDDAWKALWERGNPHYLPAAIHGSLEGRGLRSLTEVAVAEVGPLVLFNREPWGGVTIELHNAEVTGLDQVTGGAKSYDEKTGAFKGELVCHRLAISGRASVLSGLTEGSSAETGDIALALPPQGSSDNVTLAKSYQQELTGSDNGRYMVGTYHQFNDCYHGALQSKVYGYIWKNDTTGGHDSQFYAQHTANAAQPANRGSTVVNTTGYPQHSFYQQTALKAQLYFEAKAAKKQGDMVQYNRLMAAGLATSTFAANSVGPSQKPQTVDAVLGVVKSTKSSEIVDDVPPDERPDWHAEQEQRALARHAQLLAEGVPTPVTAPAGGHFHGAVETLSLQFTATIAEGGAVSDGALDGDAPPVAIATSGLEGGLGRAVASALRQAQFLEELMGKRLGAALRGGPLPDFLGKVLHLALAAEG